jgi:hypothetical protein
MPYPGQVYEDPEYYDDGDATWDEQQDVPELDDIELTLD